jgi:hypothetical protein
MPPAPWTVFCEFTSCSSEQCGEATFSEVAGINMVNLRLQCGRRDAQFPISIHFCISGVASDVQPKPSSQSQTGRQVKPASNRFRYRGDQARRRTLAFGPPTTQCCAAVGCRRGKGLASTNVGCDFFACLHGRHESVTFSRISVQDAAFVRARELRHD